MLHLIGEKLENDWIWICIVFLWKPVTGEIAGGKMWEDISGLICQQRLFWHELLDMEWNLWICATTQATNWVLSGHFDAWLEVETRQITSLKELRESLGCVYFPLDLFGFM